MGQNDKLSKNTGNLGKMDIFKYRNLALGCVGFILSLLASYYFPATLCVAVFCCSLFAILAFVLIYFITKNKKVLKILIRYLAMLLLILVAMIIGIFVFNADKEIYTYCDGEEHKIQGEIKNEKMKQSYLGIYIANITRIDEKECSFEVIFYCPDGKMIKGNTFEAGAYIQELENSEIGFDEKSAYLDDGILASAVCEKYTCTNEIIEDVSNKTIFESINEFLDKRFEKHLNEETSSLLGALFLGNREDLDASTNKEFTRLGISHILSLSGMHLTIIAFIFSLLIGLLSLHRVANNLLIILSIIIFTAITGFSESCVRAAIMLIVFYTIDIFGVESDNISTLLLSVTLICVVKPYLLFSVSLQLSFLCMLACFVSSKFIYKSKKLKGIRNKILRYIVFSLVASLFILAFTMPIIFFKFGSFSLLSPLSNVMLVPLFSALIYACPIYLALCDFGFIGAFVAWVCERITAFGLSIIEFASSWRHIMVPTRTIPQLIGMIIVIASLVLLLFLSRKRIKIVMTALIVGILVFALGSASLIIHRVNNFYVGAYSHKENDIVYLENENKLTMIDITKTATSSIIKAKGLQGYVGYCEIENYIITDYSFNTPYYLYRLCQGAMVRRIYLPIPVSENDKITCDEIKMLFSELDTELIYFESNINLDGIQIDFSKNQDIARSDRKSVSFTFVKNGCKFTYLGASSYEILDYFTEKEAYTSDIVVFGSYGPKYKTTYYYEMPYLDKTVFLGNSKEYIDKDLLNKIEDTVCEAGETGIKFKLEN